MRNELSLKGIFYEKKDRVEMEEYRIVDDTGNLLFKGTRFKGGEVFLEIDAGEVYLSNKKRVFDTLEKVLIHNTSITQMFFNANNSETIKIIDDIQEFLKEINDSIGYTSYVMTILKTGISINKKV